MKLTSTLLFILITVGVAGQEPPKKANKIIVMTKDSTNNLINKIALTLFDHGFSIEQKDEQIKIITTKARPSRTYGTMSMIRVKVVDTAIIFTSMISLNSDRDIFGTKESVKSFYDVDYRGSKKSPMREAWNELNEIAKLFGDKIVYSK
jgi:hypothetical protein